MRNLLSFGALGAALLATTFLAVPAHAQSNPSAQQIINSLKPTGMLSDTTRGIRPLGPGGSASPGMAPMAPGMAMSAEPAPSTNLDIVFGSGSATLTPEATAELDQLGKALTSSTLASYHFKIIGHTDTTGLPAANQTLSEQRAAAVKVYLETKFGVPDTRLEAEGVGEADLLVATPPQTPELVNRRVQVINLGQ